MRSLARPLAIREAAGRTRDDNPRYRGRDLYWAGNRRIIIVTGGISTRRAQIDICEFWLRWLLCPTIRDRHACATHQHQVWKWSRFRARAAHTPGHRYHFTRPGE